MLVWVTLSLAAPSCLPGQVAAGAEHCCWPGQTYDGTCSGTPTCPPGTTSDGNSCRSQTRITSAVETSSGMAVVGQARSTERGTEGAAARQSPRSKVGVTLSEPVVLGALTNEGIWNALLDTTPAIRVCSADAPATATLRLISDAAGKVTTATARDAAPASFGACLSTVALTWTLPPSNGGIVVTTVPVAVAGR